MGTGFARLWRLAIPCADDAGDRRELLSLRQLPSGTPRLQRLRELTQNVYSGAFSFRRNWLAFVALVLIFLGLGATLGSWLQSLNTPAWLLGFIMMFPGVVVARLWVAWAMRRLGGRAAEVVDAFLEEGICPTCAYNLAGVMSGEEHNALVACSECGARWRRDRVRRVVQEETDTAREPWSLRAAMRNAGARIVSMEGVDDLGRTTVFVRQLDLAGVEKAATGERQERVRRARRRLAAVGRWSRALLGLLIVPFAAVLAWSILRRPLASLGMADAFHAFAVLLYLWWIVVLLRSDVGRRGPKRRALFLDESLCPACASDLGPADADGWRDCPDCRTCWKAGTGAEGPA